MDYSEILGRRFKGREWTLSGNDLATLVFFDAGPVLTAADLDPLWTSVETEIITETAERDKAQQILGGVNQWVLIEILLEVIGKAIKQGKINSTTRADILIAKWDEANG